ncbi:MAG: chromosome segregation protein SMC [Anaerolineaceae bacterium]
MPTKLNSLDLNGYKTFARQTGLAFPAKITAIVGPNGSGKSNVADAIRWVLGEQSYSTLRAKRTEDMIYSGSDSRARAGMASVSITFNNENNWLPIDYAEVVLTRRAYRDGQNEYLINNQRVRLKDFHELLAKTGLSDRTYTIIGQGLVDLALSIKPDERRKLFEEAAGIGLYQSRKEEALKRLEATQRNLERASDILDEIRPRLRSLERQAVKVGEYKTVQENLQRNLRDWYGFHWLKSLNEIEEIRQALALSSEQASLSQMELEQNKLETTRVREQIAGLRSELNGIHESLREFHDESQAKNQDMAILEERKHALSDSQVQVEQEITRLEEIIKAAEAELSQGQSESGNAQLELERVKKAQEDSLGSLNEARSVKQEIDTKRAKSQAAILNIEKELIVLRSKQSESSDRIEEITKLISAFDSRKDSLIIEAKQFEAKKNEAINQVQAQEGLLAENSLRRAKLAEEQNQARQMLESNHQQANRLNLEKNKLSSRLELLIQGQATLAGFSEGAKALLKISQKIGKSDSISDFASKLNVEEKFERAIIAALGEAVDVLVLRGKRIDDDFIESYQNQISDRVAVIDATGSDFKTVYHLKDQSGVYGLASKLVKTDANFTPVVDKLFGNFVVVEDIKTALRLQKSQRELNIVTLAGELVLTNGLVLMGKTKGTGKVAYSRTVNEIDESINALNEEIAKTVEISNKTEKTLEQLNQQMGELIKSQRDIESKLSDSRRLLNMASLESEKAANQLRMQEAQRHEMTVQLERLENIVIDQQKSEKALQAQLSNLQQEDQLIKREQSKHNVLELERTFQELEADLKLISQTIAHQQASQSVTVARLNENKSRLANFNLRKSDQATQLASITQQMQATSEALKSIETQILAVQQKDLSPKSTNLSAMDLQNAKLAEIEAQIQKELLIKDREVTHYQLELARQQEKMQSLRIRIEDDFGLIELEYRNEYESSKSTPLPFPDLVIETLPETKTLPEGIDNDIREQKAQIRRIGVVNLEAENEYLEVKERYTSLTTQISDLHAAISDIDRIVKELDEIMRKEFLETFKAVSIEFTHMFTRLFNGGSARLVLSDETSPIEGGIEIEARLPGRREQGLVLLSGGERSLTAVALIFALLKISPTPICVLDEVDAMLDESNVGRFIDLLKDLSTETQFLLITHNRNTVSAADVIYGVTMGKDSASQVISLRLDEIDEEFIK